MKPTSSARFLPALLAVLVTGFLVSGSALADSAVMASNGTLYEVFPAQYGDLALPPDDSIDASTPVLALRTTPSGRPSVLEVVDGTLDSGREGSVSIELEETTGTLFVAYTKARGFMADMHVAIRRDGGWSGQDILPNQGFYLSINPRVVVTRQRYVDFDEQGTVRHEDAVHLLPDLVGGERPVAGPVRADFRRGRRAPDRRHPGVEPERAPPEPAASPTRRACRFRLFSFPAIQPDPTTNGGVLATFANLATRKQQALRITFPDDLTLLLAAPGGDVGSPGSLRPSPLPDRPHRRSGKDPDLLPEHPFRGRGGRLPEGCHDVPLGRGVHDAVRPQRRCRRRQPRELALRSDLSAEKATRLVKALAEKD